MKKTRKKNSTPNSTPRSPGKNGRPPEGTPDWTGEFLAALVDGLHVRDAAAQAKIHPSVAYQKRKDDEAFRLAWQEAIEIGTGALAAEAARRAYHGTLKPVFHKGQECGQIREYSDTLLMFLLRAREPEKYRDNFKHEHTGPGGGAIPISIVRFNRHEPANVPAPVSGGDGAGRAAGD